jgi:hypothetical protein
LLPTIPTSSMSARKQFTDMLKVTCFLRIHWICRESAGSNRVNPSRFSIKSILHAVLGALIRNS